MFQQYKEIPIIKKYDWSDKLVLIIEDDLFNTKLLFKALSVTKVKYLHAIDGNSAIEIFRNTPEIDLVLLDIRLPDINGYDVANKLLKIKPEINIIAQTAYASDDDKRKCLANGCCDYISKPISREDLLEKMDKYLS